MAYGVQVTGPVVINGTTYDQIEAQAFARGEKVIRMGAAGAIDPTFAGFIEFEPRFNFTTHMVSTFLAACGISGLVLSGAGAVLYNHAVDLTTALRKTGGSHESLTIATGLVVPRQLSVQQGQPAKLTFEIFGINAAGTTDPVVVSQTATLASNNGIGELFKLAKVMVNGIELEGVQEWTLDFGISVKVVKGSGALYPQLVYIEERKPKFTFKVNDDGAIAQIGLTGLPQSSTDSVIYLRKMTANGTQEADASLVHMALTIDDGLWYVTDKGGSHPGELLSTVVCEPIYDGTNAIIAISTGVAIS